MAASHKLKIAFDEAAGELTASHRVVTTVGGHAVAHERPIELAGDAAAALKALIDDNREQMEQEAAALAIQHAAAVNGDPQRGVKPLKVGGSLGRLGGGADVSKT